MTREGPSLEPGEIACIDLHQTGSVREGSDRLQLIIFWPSCVPREGGLRRGEIFGSALLQPARSACVSPSAFFIFVEMAYFRGLP